MHRNSSSGIMGNDKARTLTTNVDDKISSLQWRKEVLERVQKLFEIFIKKVIAYFFKVVQKLFHCLRPKAKDLRITRVVVLGFFI